MTPQCVYRFKHEPCIWVGAPAASRFMRLSWPRIQPIEAGSPVEAESPPATVTRYAAVLEHAAIG